MKSNQPKHLAPMGAGDPRQGQTMINFHQLDSEDEHVTSSQRRGTAPMSRIGTTDSDQAHLVRGNAFQGQTGASAGFVRTRGGQKSDQIVAIGVQGSGG
jgi:hypothetical protein